MRGRNSLSRTSITVCFPLSAPRLYSPLPPLPYLRQPQERRQLVLSTSRAYRIYSLLPPFLSFIFFVRSRHSIKKSPNRMSSRRPFRVLAPSGGGKLQASDALAVNGERVPDPPGFSAAVAVSGRGERERRNFFRLHLSLGRFRPPLSLTSTLDLLQNIRPPPHAPLPPAAAAAAAAAQLQPLPPPPAEPPRRRSKRPCKRGPRGRSSPSSFCAS